MKLTVTLFVLAAVVAAVSRRRGVPAVRDVEAVITRHVDAAMVSWERSMLAAVAG